MNRDTSCGAPALGVKYLQSMGSVTLLMSIISFGIAVGLDSYLSSPKIGYWYTALITAFTGLFAILARTRGVVISTCVISVIAIILGLSSSFLNGADGQILESIVACSTPSYQIYGNKDYTMLAMNCTNDYPKVDCACVTTSECYAFNGKSDCNLITSEYAHMVHAATAFDVLALFAVFTLSILTCCSLCCPGSLGDEDPTLEDRYAPNVGAAYAVSQPGVVYVGTVAMEPQAQPNQPVPYGQQAQIAQLRAYEQNHAIATAIPVTSLNDKSHQNV